VSRVPVGPSDIWDPMASGPFSISIRPVGPDGLSVTCGPFSIRPVAPEPMGPFLISIRPVGPDGLCVTCTYGIIHPMGPDGSRVTCTCGTFLHLHWICGTQWLACHLYLLCRRGLINSKKTSMPGSQTRDPEEGMHGLYHCARCLVVLTCLRGHYSIIFSVWMAYRLTYIGYFPFKWKQICAR